MSDKKPQVKRVPVECYSRIVGYLRPVQNWHAAKRAEFKARRTYDVPTTGTLEKMGGKEGQ